MALQVGLAKVRLNLLVENVGKTLQMAGDSHGYQVRGRHSQPHHSCGPASKTCKAMVTVTMTADVRVGDAAVLHPSVSQVVLHIFTSRFLRSLSIPL